MNSKKKERISAKKRFHQAIKQELREHRSSFIVFTTLRFFVIFVLIRQVFLQSYESVFFCALTLLLLYIPSWIQVKMHIELPPALEITVLCFIFAAEILGEVNAFYLKIPSWDTMLHTLSLAWTGSFTWICKKTLLLTPSTQSIYPLPCLIRWFQLLGLQKCILTENRWAWVAI